MCCERLHLSGIPLGQGFLFRFNFQGDEVKSDSTFSVLIGQDLIIGTERRVEGIIC